MTGWWLPLVLGAGVTLALLAAFPPWPEELVAPTGSNPWWVTVPAVAVAALLALGARHRRCALAAVILAGLTVGLGVQEFLRQDDAGLRPYASLAEVLAEPGPSTSAPLAVAFAALGAAAVGLVLARRRTRWPDLSQPDARRRDLPGLVALTVIGAVLGAGLHLGAGAGAERIGVVLRGGEFSPVDASSEPVPEGDRPVGELLSHHDVDEITIATPGESVWATTLPGEVELNACTREDPLPDTPATMATTLVSVEEVADGDAVVGYDTGDGSERWRYTVHARQGDPVERDPDELDAWSDTVRTGGESRLGQVAVAAPCTVLVVVDPYSVVALDAATGDVRNVTTLPVNPQGSWSTTRSGEEEQPHWRFVLPSLPAGEEADASGSEDSARHLAEPRLVSLDTRSALRQGSDVAYLAAPHGLLELDRHDGTVRGLSLNDSLVNCEYLADYTSPARLLVQGCVDPVIVEQATPSDELRLTPDQQGVPDDELATLHSVFSYHQVPVPWLGCDSPPRITDLRNHSLDTVLVGTWCPEEGDGPVLLQLRDGDEGRVDDGLVLPPETDLPLYPESVFHWSWLENGGHLAHRYRHGDRLYEADEPLAAVAWPGGSFTEHQSFHGVTESGELLVLEFDRHEDLARASGSTEVAAAPCSGERDIAFDPVNAHVLLFCATGDETTVTAVADGPGYVPAGEE